MLFENLIELVDNDWQAKKKSSLFYSSYTFFHCHFFYYTIQEDANYKITNMCYVFVCNAI